MIAITQLVFTVTYEVTDFGVFTNERIDSVSIVGNKGKEVSFRVTLDSADLEIDTRVNLRQLLIDMKIEVEKAWNESE